MSRLGLSLGLGFGLVVLGDIGVSLSNWDDLIGVRIVLGEAKIHIYEGGLAGSPRDHFRTKADLKGVDDF